MKNSGLLVNFTEKENALVCTEECAKEWAQKVKTMRSFFNFSKKNNIKTNNATNSPVLLLSWKVYVVFYDKM